jgi:hypothetical protein
VSLVLSESESGTSSAFAADVPVAAVIVAANAAATDAAAAVVVAAIVATGFALFCCGQGGVPDAFRLP